MGSSCYRTCAGATSVTDGAHVGHDIARAGAALLVLPTAHAHVLAAPALDAGCVATIRRHVAAVVALLDAAVTLATRSAALGGRSAGRAERLAAAAVGTRAARAGVLALGAVVRIGCEL